MAHVRSAPNTRRRKEKKLTVNVDSHRRRVGAVLISRQTGIISAVLGLELANPEHRRRIVHHAYVQMSARLGGALMVCRWRRPIFIAIVVGGGGASGGQQRREQLFAIVFAPLKVEAASGLGRRRRAKQLELGALLVPVEGAQRNELGRVCARRSESRPKPKKVETTTTMTPTTSC